MKPFVFILIIINLFFYLPAEAAADKDFPYDSVISNPSLKLGVDFKINISNEQLKFLLKNLDLTCDLIRFLDLDRFEAKKLESGFYRAKDQAGLEGYIYEKKITGDTIIFGGEGTYTDRRLPTTISGRVVLVTAVRITSHATRQLKNTIYIQLKSNLLHYTTRLFSPIIRRVIMGKTENLKNVARKSIKKMNKQNKEIHRKLTNRDDKRAGDWKIIFIDSEGSKIDFSKY